MTKPERMDMEEKKAIFDSLQSGDRIELWYDSMIRSGDNWNEFTIARRSFSKKYNTGKLSMKPTGQEGKARWFLYDREGRISMAMGDMAASLISMRVV